MRRHPNYKRPHLFLLPEATLASKLATQPASFSRMARTDTKYTQEDGMGWDGMGFGGGLPLSSAYPDNAHMCLYVLHEDTDGVSCGGEKKKRYGVRIGWNSDWSVLFSKLYVRT